MPIRRSELIDVSWDDNFCPHCGEEVEDCECSDEEDDLEDNDPPEPQDDDEANWAGDTSERSAY